MSKRLLFFPLLVVLLFVLIQVSVQKVRTLAGSLSVVSTFPAARSLSNAPDSSISVTFDRALNSVTVTEATFMAFGKWSGPVIGTLSLTNGNQTAILTSDAPFFSGEMVMVVLSDAIQAEDGSFLSGYSFQFWIRAEPGGMSFTVMDTLSTRSKGSTVAYGGVATDYNQDGWADLTIVNELTADLRVFLNKADGTGLFHDFIQPTFPVGQQASPSEPADFNGDGKADIAVVNIAVDSVSILLGNGDGTFAPHQWVAVGLAPRGIAVLDVDGDGDIDIVNTNSGGAGSLSLLLNDGNGVFGAPVFFEGGGNGEWGLAAADMNEDGRLDLIVGTHTTPYAMITLRNNGDGTFSQMDSKPSGGSVWMVGTGDVNGDGHEDVHVANGFSNNGAILLGDGMGHLTNPTTHPTDQITLATDLGDLDGDGDLDWITSSYGGDWRLFLNDGNGAFTFNREFDAISASSCALFVDLNNDGILDLALIDEISDTVQLVRQNVGATPTPTATSTLTPTPSLTQTPATGTPSVTPEISPSPSSTPDPKLLNKSYLPVIQKAE